MSDEREYLELGWIIRPEGKLLDVFGCPDCGALVFWQGSHDNFHRVIFDRLNAPTEHVDAFTRWTSASSAAAFSSACSATNRATAAIRRERTAR